MINASTMATIGGTSAQKEAYIFGTYSAASSAANTVIVLQARMQRSARIPHTAFFFPLIVKFPLFSFEYKNAMNNANPGALMA